MARRGLRAGLAGIAALLVSACLVSEAPLIQSGEGAAPLRAGDYEQYELEDGDEPEFDGRAVVVIRDGDYLIAEDPDDEGSFMRLKQIGRGLYAAQVWEEGDDSYMYLAMRPQRGGGALFWFGDCTVLTDAERSDLGLTMDDRECVLDSFSQLEAALEIVVERSGPMLEWRRAD